MLSMLVPDMMPRTIEEAFIFCALLRRNQSLSASFNKLNLCSRSMKALCVHAHYDDFEFVAAGTFELWRRKLGPGFRGRVLVCTDGKAGHHFRTREETGQIRLREQEASAKIGAYEFELLRGPNGEPLRE